MCVGGASASTSGVPHAAACQQDEISWLREQNARLREQQLAQAGYVKELRFELTQRHEEEMAQRIARHAKETAACVLRHEEELRRMAARYEEQLLVRQPPTPSVGRQSLTPPASRSSSMGALMQRRGGGSDRSWNPRGGDCDLTDIMVSKERQRVEDAQIALATAQEQLQAAEAEAAKYRKRAQKLKASGAKEKRGMRDRFCSSAASFVAREGRSETRTVFLLWRSVSMQSCAKTPGHLDGARVQGDSLEELPRPQKSAPLVARRRRSEQQAVVQPTSCLEHGRTCGEEAKPELQQSAAARFNAVSVGSSWGRSVELLFLVAPWNAWHREVVRARASKMARRGDVVLNSGEAARRTQQQLDEARSKAAERLSLADQQIAAAAKREARTDARAACAEVVIHREQVRTLLHAVLQSWSAARTEALHMAALSQLRQETQSRQFAAEKKQQTALECARNESSAALHQAWNEAADASRRAAALERRERHLIEELESRPATAGATTNRCPSRVGMRPTTATLVQVQQQLELEGLHMNAAATEDERPPEMTGNEESGHAPEVWTLPEPDRHRTEVKCLLDSMLDRQERSWLIGILQTWRRVADEERHARELRRIQADALEQVFAARDGRKGLFIAAIGQQVRQWQASAFATWRCSALELARTRAVAKGATAESAATPRHPGGIQRPALLHSARSPRTSTPGRSPRPCFGVKGDNARLP